jgi:hypothetical protein
MEIIENGIDIIYCLLYNRIVGDEIQMDDKIYKEHGYQNRRDYLFRMAEQYEISIYKVYMLANMFGPKEDFSGLIEALKLLKNRKG